MNTPMSVFYFDASIWLDLIENREPQGEKAEELLIAIIRRNDKIAISEVIYFELRQIGYSKEMFQKMISVKILPFLLRVSPRKEHFSLAHIISKKRDVPKRDVLHALIAKEHGCYLISRDQDFLRLKDITRAYLPEDFI